MNSKEIAVKEYYNLKPNNFPIVESLQINQRISHEEHIFEMSLLLAMRSVDDTDVRRLELTFCDVRNLRLNQENAAITFPSLLIEPSNDQWERVNYRVFESEQDVDFAFLCDSFTAKLSSS